MIVTRLTLVLVVCATFALSQSITSQVFDAAINQMVTNEASSNSLKTISQKYFGTYYPKPPYSCGITSYPSNSQLSPLIKQILSQKMIIYGANSITNVPKRFNASSIIGSRGGLNYYKVTGFEADIGQAIANLIAAQYNVAGGIQAYFSLTPWYANSTFNIVSNLMTPTNPPYDAIISGMTVTATWDIVGNGTMVDRSTLIDFTCPYQDSVNSVVLGKKPLPNGYTINVVTDCNRTGIIFCAQAETDLATTTVKYFSAASIIYSNNISNDTINQLCHAYISPIINALWDAQNSGGSLLYIGPVGPSAGPIAVGLRKEPSAGTSMMMLSSLFVTLFALFVTVL